jgi:hypothetical protein
MPSWIDITGQTINGWKALEYVGHELWRCSCPKCGMVLLKKSSELRHLKNMAGCKKCEKKTHGHTVNGIKSKPFKVWESMNERCFNPNCSCYFRYGGRGITVCDRWRRFENFFSDMGNPPNGKSLNRKDNNGNYCPDNCEWATAKEQGNNRSDNLILLVNGQKMTGTQAAAYFGYHPASLHRMLRKNGVSRKTTFVRLAQTGVLTRGGKRRVFVCL